jgi:hypothetical protein
MEGYWGREIAKAPMTPLEGQPRSTDGFFLVHYPTRRGDDSHRPGSPPLWNKVPRGRLVPLDAARCKGGGIGRVPDRNYRSFAKAQFFSFVAWPMPAFMALVGSRRR